MQDTDLTLGRRGFLAGTAAVAAATALTGLGQTTAAQTQTHPWRQRCALKPAFAP